MPSAADSSVTKYLDEAIQQARAGVHNGRGGPFGAVVVRDGAIVGRGCNGVTSLNDPTAHAEVMAIRDACRALGTYSLAGCEIYASCEPCPMCLAAIYWARLERLYFAAPSATAAKAGFDDEFIRRELQLPPGERSIVTEHVSHVDALAPFIAWREKADRVGY